MSNDKHPDHHFDDDLIAQLYDASAEEMQPSSDLDDLILSTLHKSAVANVSDIAEEVDNKVARLPLKKRRWAVPNSLVACLVVSVMVGLIYRENAGQLLISDPTELDYAIPMPSVERDVRAKAKSKAIMLDEGLSAESDEISVGFEEKEIQESQLLMDSASSFSELQSKLRSEVQGTSVENVEALVVKKQEVANQEPSTLQTGGSVVPSAPVESKKIATRKAKKSKPKSMMQQAAPSRMLMMSPPIQSENRTRDTINFDVEFNKIRKLSDEGDVSGARALLDTLIAKYPSMELPADIALLKEGSK